MSVSFEKFSLYDFFNLIIAGGIFIWGLQISDIKWIMIFAANIRILKNEIIEAVFILIICYVIGLQLQVIALGIEKFIKKKIMKSLLRDNNKNVIKNRQKLKIYRKKAEKLFEAKKINTADWDNEEYYEYFFSYCDYFIQEKGKEKKAEKMRGLRGLSSLLMVCFLIMTFMNFIWGNKNLVIIIIFLISAVLNGIRMIINTIYRIRIVLATYEIVGDLTNESI